MAAFTSVVAAVLIYAPDAPMSPFPAVRFIVAADNNDVLSVMASAALTVIVSPVAVIVPSDILPDVVVVRVIFFDEPPAVTVPSTRFPESLFKNMEPSVVAACIVVWAPKFIVLAASAPILPADVKLIVVPTSVLPDVWVICDGAVELPIVRVPADVILPST